MITDAALIDGSSSGKAIDTGGGNNTLTVSGGAASIIGDISGGVGGTNTLSLSIGAGNSFSYGYTVSNVADVEVNGGTTTLSGANTYAGKTRVNSGVLLVANTTGSGTGTAGWKSRPTRCWAGPARSPGR